MIDFLILALGMGVCFAPLGGILGSVVLWRRLSFLGDTLAHGGLLGLALASAFHFPLFLGILLVGMAVVVVLVNSRDRFVSSDTHLSILSHGSMALGLVALSLLPQLRQNFSAFLFGDILASTAQDLAVMAALSCVVTGGLLLFWRPLMTTLISEELAQAQGLPVLWIRLSILTTLTLVVALALQVFGALLLTALLIIPAASARTLSKSPGSMMIWATTLCALSVGLGLVASAWYDLPTGPAIVVAALALFIIALLLQRTS